MAPQGEVEAEEMLDVVSDMVAAIDVDNFLRDSG